MSRKTDLEFAEHQKKVGSAFIHVNLFNGWDTKMDYFIDENFEYELVFSNARKTIKEKGKLSDPVIEILNSLIHNVNIESIKSHYESGWDDLGSFVIGFPCTEKNIRIIVENPIGNEEIAQLFRGTKYLESEDISYTESEKILFQVKREFDTIFSKNIKKYQY